MHAYNSRLHIPIRPSPTRTTHNNPHVCNLHILCVAALFIRIMDISSTSSQSIIQPIFWSISASITRLHIHYSECQTAHLIIWSHVTIESDAPSLLHVLHSAWLHTCTHCSMPATLRIGLSAIGTRRSWSWLDLDGAHALGTRTAIMHARPGPLCI